MAQAVSRCPLTAEARVHGTGTGFSPSSLVSPVNIIPTLLRTHVTAPRAVQ
jgi:hypothetical protein